ncbi:DUF3152 domain-containing protein [Saccharothrix longispora]|uniref:DUF3152 domain-containing protein n=1 Tax=Saccharothrix longispora TaxID=33920 RepID=UPI0028FD4E59|nr:DUF3152 domain-containing protein [Saccharothrix longispora]MBY8847420.1 DUF3152 domain-containing protein [Saccharothrix sp. MB29]MDU0290996.1 DUF3152 domain-containing protein [Saccharothrix longispora]
MNRTTQDPAPSSGDRPSLSEDRYRRGARRTGGEPLAASWTPAGRGARRRGRGLKGLIANYGWRIYAVPVLLVLTALVVLDTAAPTTFGTATDQVAEGAPTGDAAAASTPRSPVASEKPPPQIDLKNFPTAVLPEGPRFSEQGAGTWQLVPGSMPQQVGTGTLYRYDIAIEDGVEAADYGGDRDAFARTVDAFLADPRSWVGTGQVAMQRVEGGDVDFTISLTTTSTTHAMCGFSIQFEASCWHPPSGRVIINAARWVRGGKAFGNDIGAYRTYAINHEVGHALGNRHEGCAVDGGPAPVMMQQSFGVANDYVAQLNSVDGGDRNAVAADGKVCTPNPFPVAPQ